MVRVLIKKLLRNLLSKEESSSYKGKGWIGVDLDGTLAVYDGWYGPAHIGEPIPPMIERVKTWIDQGVEVRVFTARASVPEYIPYVVKWIEQQGLPPLKVTNVKDFGMIRLWDDRCIEVETNKGAPKYNSED